MADIERIQIERNARSEGKEPPPELDEDGTYADKVYHELVTMKDEDVIQELEEDF